MAQVSGSQNLHPEREFGWRGSRGNKEPNYESIGDNIDDAINYLIILKAVLEEQRIDIPEKK